jgi:hypothetical protein
MSNSLELGKMPRNWFCWFLFLLMLIVGVNRATAATTAQVEQAINKAKEYLYSKQKNGNWENVPVRDATSVGGGEDEANWGGTTALCVYALLAAGENPQDPRLVEAIEFLKKADIVGTYASSLRAQVWLLLPRSDETRNLMRRDLHILLAAVKDFRTSKGMYDYRLYTPSRSEEYSHSRSQYGVLGVWAAEQFGGIEIKLDYWQMIEEGWIRNQYETGGWSYQHPKHSPHPETPGMTAAGIATLFITQDYLHGNEGINCKGNVTNPAIERGLKWISANFDKVATDTKYNRDFPLISLYAIERIGVASGIKYFNNIDWYQKGADWLIKNQKPTGDWTNDYHIPGTAFAVLFLVRGRAPVVINKLDYTTGEKPVPWNQRPRDVANVTRWIGQNFERDLNWQIMPLSVSVKDFHDAPILYMSGNEKLNLTAEQKQKLKEFVEEGGLIVGNADCGSMVFSQSFKALGQELFPKYEFRPLPQNHLIFNNNFKADKWRTKPAVWGLSNEVRQLMLLVPTADPAKAWQLRNPGGKEEAFQLMANIFMYMNDRQGMRFKGDSHWVMADPAAKAPTRALKLGRVQSSNNWDPEPAGWRRLTNILRNSGELDLQVSPTKLSAPNLAELKVLHITGTSAWKLDDKDRAALKKFIDGGGTILIDAAGGNSEFATTAENEIASLLPESKLEMLPLDHPIYTAGGKKIGAVEYRLFAQTVTQGRVKTPRVQGVQLNGRVVLFYSREDLSAGLVGQNVDGINGYTPDFATAIMGNILLHLAGAGEPASQPASRPS